MNGFVNWKFCSCVNAPKEKKMYLKFLILVQYRYFQFGIPAIFYSIPYSSYAHVRVHAAYCIIRSFVHSIVPCKKTENGTAKRRKHKDKGIEVNSNLMLWFTQRRDRRRRKGLREEEMAGGCCKRLILTTVRPAQADSLSSVVTSCVCITWVRNRVEDSWNTKLKVPILD